jgi:hypothetical protein
MLTTESAQQIRDNVVTDANANVTVSHGEATRKLSPEAAILFDKSIIARPLMIPEVGSIHIKHTEYSYRWVACHGEHGGRIYQQRKSMGYTNASPEDADVLNGETIVEKGEIRNGDLILMKIPWERYAAHMKSNMQQAIQAQRMRGVYMRSKDKDEAPSSDVFSNDQPSRVSVSSEPGLRNADVTPFIPDNPETFFDKSEKSPNAARVRADMDARRANIAQSKQGA